MPSLSRFELGPTFEQAGAGQRTTTFILADYRSPEQHADGIPVEQRAAECDAERPATGHPRLRVWLRQNLHSEILRPPPGASFKGKDHEILNHGKILETIF